MVANDDVKRTRAPVPQDTTPHPVATRRRACAPDLSLSPPFLNARHDADRPPPTTLRILLLLLLPPPLQRRTQPHGRQREL